MGDAEFMKIVSTIEELRQALDAYRLKGKTVGLVPTMGALHEGHVSLFRRAGMDNDVVVGTIFVNRVQFNNAEDFLKYPKTPQKDIAMLEEAQCDILFMPEEAEIYSEMEEIVVDLGPLGEVMEATRRPGHFEGVTRIVYCFFSLIKPDIAYFGQKDLQQFKVIEAMTRQLNLPVELVMCPVIREDTGLAMSSRNSRLSPQGRLLASKLFTALGYAGDLLQFGDNPEKVKQKVADFLAKFPSIELEYFEIVHEETLLPATSVQQGSGYALCVAAFLEGVRLIDNIVIIS